MFDSVPSFVRSSRFKLGEQKFGEVQSDAFMREKTLRFAGDFTHKCVTLNEKQNVAQLWLFCLVKKHPLNSRRNTKKHAKSLGLLRVFRVFSERCFNLQNRIIQPQNCRTPTAQL